MKQTLFFLLLLVSAVQTMAQTNNILRGLVTAKGEDKKSFESRENGTNDFFKQGIGKIVIVR